MSKHEILTTEEMCRFKLNPELLTRIEKYRLHFGFEKADMRILDYGCGRGRSVVKLTQEGYQVFGVDIDPEPIENGKPYFYQLGLPANDLLHVIHGNERLPFSDKFFHFVFSEQVFEHIKNLDAVAAEMSRVTCSGGEGYHIFSAPRRIIEEHIIFPFVHWLPKNRSRKFLIYLLVFLGFEPDWEEFQGKTVSEKSTVLYKYSVEKTFYRGAEEIQNVMALYSSSINFDVPTHFHRRGVHGKLLRFAQKFGGKELYKTLYLGTVRICLETVK